MIILHFFHIFNKNYDSESGTTIQRTQPYGWVFAFGGTDKGLGNPLTGLPRVSHAISSAFMVSLLSGEINKNYLKMPGFPGIEITPLQVHHARCFSLPGRCISRSATAKSGRSSPARDWKIPRQRSDS